MRQDTIGKVTERVKIAAGLFWADYAMLGEQIKDLTAAGVDWLHIEMRDGKYMDFGLRAAALTSSRRRARTPTLRSKRSCRCIAPPSTSSTS